MFRIGRIRFVLLLAVVAAAVAAGLIGRHHQRYKHLLVHEPGMMYRSAWLEPDAMSDVIEKYQIRAVVNLCSQGEMGEQRWVDERAAVTAAGARLIELPMPTSVRVNSKLVRQHIEMLSNPDNYPMLVHCQHGVTRTSKLLAIYDIVFRNMTAEDSLKAQPLLGREDHNVNIRAFVRGFEQDYQKVYPLANADSLNILRN